MSARSLHTAGVPIKMPPRASLSLSLPPPLPPAAVSWDFFPDSTFRLSCRSNPSEAPTASAPLDVWEFFLLFKKTNKTKTFPFFLLFEIWEIPPFSYRCLILGRAQLFFWTWLVLCPGSCWSNRTAGVPGAASRPRTAQPKAEAKVPNPNLSTALSRETPSTPQAGEDNTVFVLGTFLCVPLSGAVSEFIKSGHSRRTF